MMRLRVVTCLMLGAAAIASADSINLRNGDSVQGTYLGGSARQIRVDVNGNIQTYDIGQVQSVVFSDANYQAPSQTGAYPPPQSAPPREAAYNAPPPGYNPNGGPGGPLGITIPGDTQLVVRMIDSVDSEKARLGQTFRASIDEPVVVNGQTAVTRGADVIVKLVQDQQSGKIEGRTALTLALVSISVSGQPVPVTSSDVTTESTSRGKRSAGVIGGGTALGAIVGGLAGGGKGAAIGAASGATLGAGAEVLTKGQTVKIPSETRLRFRLQTPVQL